MNIRILMITLLAIVCNTTKAQVDGSPLDSYWNDDIKAYVIGDYNGLAALQKINSNGNWSDYADISIYIREGDSDDFINEYNNYYGESGSNVEEGEEGQNWIALGSDGNPFNSVHFYCRASHYNDFVAEGQGSGPLYAFGTDESGNYGEGSDSSPFIISSAEDIQALIDILKFLYYDSYAFSYYVNLESLSTEYPFIDSYFQQTAEIDLGTISEGIGTYSNPFCGIYDGGGYNINVNVEADDDGYVQGALFNETKYATIKNLSITGENSNTYEMGAIGGIVGYANESITLENCIINVEVERKQYSGGLIGGDPVSHCSNGVIITDCFNKGAADLEQFPGSADYHKNDQTVCFSWTSDPGEGTYACPLKLSSLEELKNLSEDENAKNWIEEMGLCYELTDNAILQDVMLVDPNGRYTNPDGISNEDYYIEKFCGTLIGNYTYDNSGSTEETGNAVISGITDKAIFGTITGNSKIERIGFVNCYNEETKKVCIAKEISDDCALTIQECYSDGYFDFKNNSDGSDNTLTNCYSRSYTPNPTIADFGESNNNYIKASFVSVNEDESISLDDFQTDAIPGIIDTDHPATLFTFNSTPDPRLKFKYNLVDEDNVINLLTLKDITTLGTEAAYLTDDEIKSTDFNPEAYSSYTIKGFRYLRLAHNDWESVCLPFAYNLRDIDSHFKAYTYITGGTGGATFVPLTNNEVEAGQPVLFFNSGKDENVDFVVSVYDPNGISLVEEGTGDDTGTFYGVLQTTGLESTGATKCFEEDCFKAPEGDETRHYMYVYKIAGAKTNDGGGTLKQCQEASWIYPYRTYLKFPESSFAKSINFSIYDDSATSIDAAELAPTIVATGEIYGIDGRKVSAKGLNSLKPGLYIMNGKKYVVK